METRPLRSYGRRKGKPLSARKERLVQDLLPKLHLPLGKPPPENLRNLFRIPVTEVWLEIGFGSGEHLLWQSDHHKNVGFIGCEPFINGVARLLGDIEDRGIRSILVHDGDVRDVLVWLPDGSLAKVFLLFPDPWPKKRQQKRRLVSSDTIREIARVLAPGGELRFASDDAEYATHALFTVDGSGSFKWLAEGERPADWPETRYERKALNEGRKPVYLSWRRL
jgi:tRNA (guanine-N7-)-methyltransferase